MVYGTIPYLSREESDKYLGTISTYLFSAGNFHVKSPSSELNKSFLAVF